MTPAPTSWWRDRRFRQLLAVRVTGQGGDGVFQAGLASYALFSTDQASAGELALVAAVVLLPYSLLGPWVGVLLDRWQRRQVLLLVNLVRALVLGLLTWVVLAGLPQGVVYGGALVALGANRFLLAGLSAALPHTVPVESLTDANALTPTLGTAAFVSGLAAGATLRGLTSAGHELLLALAAVVYLGAGLLALRMPRQLLGPDPSPDPRPRPAVSHLVRDTAAGLEHLRSRPRAAVSLAALTSMRLWFGLVTVSAVLTLRNTAADEGAAIARLGGFTTATALGFLLAVALTPPVAHRWGRSTTLATGLWVAAAAPVASVVSTSTTAWWVTGAILGLGAQSAKICVDAIVQADVADDVRGRVFALYDMAFNVAFVLAAAIAALVLPAQGRSAPVLLTCCAGLLLTAVAVSLSTAPARSRCAP